MLSRYVFSSQNSSGETWLFHSVLKKFLPGDSSEETLRENLFLSGQEDESVQSWLFRTRDHVSINIEVTRMCNLRCSHCFVLERLTVEEGELFEVEDFKRFLEDLKSKGVQSFNFLFSGGEVALKSERCLMLISEAKSILEGLKIRFDINTNGIHECTEDVLNFFSAFDRISISVDGTREQHNTQRKDHTGQKIDPYETTMRFIRFLVEHGFADKMIIKAAMKTSDFTLENKKAFMRELLLAGVPKEKMHFGRQFPTLHSMKESKGLQTFLEKSYQTSQEVCCRYRFMSKFFIGEAGEIYSGQYFENDQSNFLGNLKDPIEKIQERFQEVIPTCPALNDSGCRDCPALGMCWGGCFYGDVFKQGNPSKWCNQEAIIAEVQKYADEKHP